MATLWEELVRLSSPPDSPLHGLEPQYVMVMFSALANFQNMRVTQDGRPKNKTQTRRLEAKFKQHYDITSRQFKCLTALYDTGEVGNVTLLCQATLQPSADGVDTEFVRTYFESDKTTCCDRTLQCRFMKATVYTRNDCFKTEHVVKTCRAGCGARYYLNKVVVPGDVDGQPCSWHTFYAWEDGKIPPYITSKSGKAIFCTDYLTDVAIVQAKTRAGFETIAGMYNYIVRRGRQRGTTRLTGSTLMECWCILAVLKHRQGVGPSMWFPPMGHTLVAEDPQEVGIVDLAGQQSGANDWKGLRQEVEAVTATQWDKAGYTSHSCNICRQDVEFEGSVYSVQAAVVAGITATRHPKCAVYACTWDLPGLGGERFCEGHEEIYGHLCAVTTPAMCQNLHQPNRLTCETHSPLEDALRNHDSVGGWHVTQQALAEGSSPDVGLTGKLLSMLSRRNTFGHFVASYCCGIVAGVAPLWEAERSKEVAVALNDIWNDESTRPELLFYDLACRRRRYLLSNPDEGWGGTMNFVDRFHFLNHNETDRNELCNPNKKDNPLLWHLDENNDHVFKWNSSMAESNNAYISGLGHIVRKMPRALGQFVLTTNVLIHNELLLAGKLQGEEPTSHQ